MRVVLLISVHVLTCVDALRVALTQNRSNRMVDVTSTIASADSVGKVRCCCDMQRRVWQSSDRSNRCVLVRGFSACGDVPKSSWAKGGLHHYANVGGKCLLTPTDAEKAYAKYRVSGADDPEFPEFKHLIEIGPGFWNVRAPLKMFGVNFGTHMSFARLRDGSIVAIDTIDLTEQDGLKEEIDILTDHGKKLTAVLGTHPFHTLFFPGFNAVYPSGPERQYYGAPRLLRMYPEIQWAGRISSAFTKWPDLEMLLPDGGEWVAPQPESSNHLMNVLVFHKPSKTVHNDDTIVVVRSDKSGWGLTFLSLFEKFFKPGLHFHLSLWTDGLYPRHDSPKKFFTSMQRLLTWDFENLVSAHNGNTLGDAKAQVERLLIDSEPDLQKLADRFAKNEGHEEIHKWSDKVDHACG